MAIAKVADRATANSNSSVTTVDLALASLTVGNYLIVRSAADNSGTNGAARTFALTNQSGTPITIASLQYVQENIDPGSASAGTTCNIAIAKISATSGTVRITYSGTVIQACVAEEWSGIHGTTPVRSTLQSSGASGTAPSRTATPVAAGDLVYLALAIEGPGTDTYTADADSLEGTWSNLTRLSTSLGTAASNQTTVAGAKVVTGTSEQTWNPTISPQNRDWAITGFVVQNDVVAVSLTVADTSHGHTSDAVTLTAHDPATPLVVADTAHGHTTEPVALTQHHVLAAADTSHGHTVDGVQLVQHHTLVVADTVHGHTVEPVALTQHHLLAVSDAAHGHTTDTPGLVQHHVLTVAETAHGHTVDTVGLTQHHVLVVADTTHGHTVDTVVLSTQATTLVVADSVHTHTVDHVVFVQPVTTLRIHTTGREPATATSQRRPLVALTAEPPNRATSARRSVTAQTGREPVAALSSRRSPT